MPTTYIPSPRAPAAPAPGDLCVPVSEDGVLLVPHADGWRLPTMELAGAGDAVALGTVAGRPVWAATAPDGATGDLIRLDWAASLAQPDAGLTGLLARAISVMSWRRTHRYCGACRTELTDVDWAVARTCPACGLMTFAKAQPVALVAVWRHGTGGRREVLLARHTYGAQLDLWALVGGYVDPAESLEAAAHREVAEEVALRLTDLEYFGSEAWGMGGPGVLLTAYTARSADPLAEPVVDGHELAEARFFPVDALPEAIPPAYVIATRMLAHLAALPAEVDAPRDIAGPA